MTEQVLDSMELERERGITIKLQPARMSYKNQDGASYILNLIDTPGHIDFSYEVSRALRAVEGAILLVDATEGVQAQTLSVLAAAQELGLTIVPVLNKIDLASARREEVREELAKLLNLPAEEVVEVSAKSGEGVDKLLEAIVERVPPPHAEFPTTAGGRALVFDFEYSNHRGLIVYVRVFDGELKRGDKLIFGVVKEPFVAFEVGIFRPQSQATDKLVAGEIGYLVTGVKELNRARVGETILTGNHRLPIFPGYREPVPMVWASLYPESQNDFDPLCQSLRKLQLSDSSLSFEEETAGALGRGFRAGFLGLLHLEIVTERLRREHGVKLVVTAPSISFKIFEFISTEI